MLDFNKYDKYGQKLRPGNVCVRIVKIGHDRSIEFCIYKEDVSGSKSKGTFGRFITPKGLRSLKYQGVIFVFDPISSDVATTPEVRTMVREYYEGK